ncbi:hypothetical protein ACFOTA_21655 [Chitinophaga sp. GCM10012297]|uniref:Uncharacterized protein n=1 Tax=Chitinophaga chungangae TaxID=2821488 RepID=A0ABS3YJH7_9BACT|nr:hypothetical protein [Chitinophaga chungangae]MBO9154835.1 hypothetical protein [Chitinophaga chungangae]
MKSLKLSFALIVALLAVSVTYAFEASKESTDRCFTAIIVTNGVSSSILTEDFTYCSVAETAIISQGKIYLTNASIASSSPGTMLCPPSDRKFCCVMVREGDPQDPNYTLSTLLELGDGGPKRYVVTEVICKPDF